MKKSPLKKKSSTDKAKIVKQCDTLWSKIVRARHPKCEWCGKPSTDAHHMVGRRRSAYLRHCLENGVALCASCHFNFHSKESYTGWAKFEELRPSDHAHVLGNMNEVWNSNMSHYRDLLEFLKAEAGKYDA